MKKFKLIFLLSLTILSIFGTTSFASVTMTEEIANGILDYFATNLDAYDRTSTSDNELAEAKTDFANVDRLKFSQYFNENFETKLNYTGNFSWSNLTVLGYWDDVSEYPTLLFTLSNTTTGSDDLNFLFIDSQYNNSTNITGFTGSAEADDTITYVKFQIRGWTSFNSFAGKMGYGTTYYQKTNPTVQGEELNYKSLLALSPAQVVYYRPYQGTTSSKFLKNYYDADPSDPEIPDDTESGDTGGGTGGDTGGTTTPDYSDDLDNIQTGIADINSNLGNIQESIPTSGEIAGATEQGNKDFWGNKDEMNEEDYENQISEGINDSMEQITEELEQNEVFDSIAIAEQKIIDLFLEEPEDFKIEWQDVKYMNKTLVPKGEINFSQICRENETLGKVKNILNIIVSAMISLSLFKYIFNLIMVTLGIDHPLILEAEKDDITEISSTKIGNKTYVTKRTYKSDKKGGR